MLLSLVDRTCSGLAREPPFVSKPDETVIAAVQLQAVVGWRVRNLVAVSSLALDQSESGVRPG